MVDSLRAGLKSKLAREPRRPNDGMSQCEARDGADHKSGTAPRMGATRSTSHSSAFTHRYRRLVPQTELRSVLVSDFFHPARPNPRNAGVSKLNSAFLPPIRHVLEKAAQPVLTPLLVFRG